MEAATASAIFRACKELDGNFKATAFSSASWALDHIFQNKYLGDASLNGFGHFISSVFHCHLAHFAYELAFLQVFTLLILCKSEMKPDIRLKILLAPSAEQLLLCCCLSCNQITLSENASHVRLMLLRLEVSKERAIDCKMHRLRNQSISEFSKGNRLFEPCPSSYRSTNYWLCIILCFLMWKIRPAYV